MTKVQPRLVRRQIDLVGTWPPEMLPLLRRVYAARGCRDVRSAQPRLADLASPSGLSNLTIAVQLLANAIALQQSILVVGDFDCDGATACALAVRGLRLLGAQQVAYAVPHRRVHGYGLSPALVDELSQYQPDLLLTVDHGIACHAGVASAKASGWTVIVTDHHLPGPSLPRADAIVNPNLEGDQFPSKSLAGVGVVFYLLLTLRAHFRQQSSHCAAGQADLVTLLDLVAVGTVADLVPLDDNNRILVAAGIRRIRQGQACVGLQALIERCGKNAAHLSASDIGFALAPRLNAAGRLDDMALGIDLLVVDEVDHARQIAEQLEAINAQRKQMQHTMLCAATAALAKLADPTDQKTAGVCFYDPDWHPGVVGLVAAKMSERLYRPVVAIAPSEPGSDLLRGSARSIANLHVRDLLAQLQANEPGCMETFGGHAKAAGLSLRLQQLPRFKSAFAQAAAKTLASVALDPVIESDGELMQGEFSVQHAQALRFSGPWGQGFPEPLFDGLFEVVRWRAINATHLSLSLRHPQHGQMLNAIQFHGWLGQPPPAHIHCAFRLACDDYRGQGAFILIVEHLWPA